jgi:serine phosphatase RsbU (regulator of sigma subunit)
MGHDTGAALLATLLVDALQNARRADVDLAEQARRASAAVAERYTNCEFVTGQLVRIDLHTRTAIVVNAGHPLPRRVRAGRVTPIALRADPPFGAIPGCRYRVQRLPLQPGDRLLFLTDGMLERNAADLDLNVLIVACADAHPREAVQHLIAAVLNATDGELRDDATALCLDWHGGPERERTSHAGANA